MLRVVFVIQLRVDATLDFDAALSAGHDGCGASTRRACARRSVRPRNLGNSSISFILNLIFVYGGLIDILYINCTVTVFTARVPALPSAGLATVLVGILPGLAPIAGVTTVTSLAVATVLVGIKGMR